MSTDNEETNESASRFTLIFQNACDEYERLTGHDPSNHPLSLDCSRCNSPKDVLDTLRGRMQAFTGFHKDHQKLLSRLNPIIHLLFTFSATLGAGIGLAFHPASTIFAGVAVLLGAAKDVIASYDTLESLFERIHFFLDRLNCYTRMNIRMTTTMTELLGKIMAEVLIILALSTKAIKPKGIIKSVVKTLVGRTDVKNALQRLDTLTKEETVMMVASNREAIYDLEQLINNIWDNVETTNDAMDQLTRHQRQDKIQTWLLPPNPSINHNIVLGTPHRITANWFFQDNRFRDWKENGSLLWISGNPGVGKSVICSAIIEDIKRRHEDAKALIAYYYFDFRDASKRNLRGLLASLLFQFGQDSDHCCNILYNLYIKCRNGYEQPSIVALTECLQSMLSLPGQVPVFIILDALDECPSTTGTWSARDEVMNFVEELVGSDHSNLHICITSRPEQDIKSILDRLTSASRRVSLHEEDGQRQDIKNFVRTFVQAVMWRWREEDRELVIDTLSQRANGMFRWVLCQLDTLRRRPPPSIRKALNELPATLYGTYERILQEIPAEKREYTYRLLQCVVSAIRPLRVEELAEIFAIDFDMNRDAAPDLVEEWRPENPEDEVLSACSTLIAIVDDGDFKIVQFSHFSVKEFLTSHRLQTSGVESIRYYYIPLNSAHTILAQACFAVLLRLDEKIDKKRLATFPLAFYAAHHWVVHAKFEDVALRIQGAMETLFNPTKPYLTAWTWIHDMDSPWVLQSIDDLAETPLPPLATPLYYAVLCGFAGLAKHLITMHGEDVDGCGHHGTPLRVASHMGHIEAARVLLDHGADVNTNAFGETPLGSAYFGGHLNVIQLLLERGANPDVECCFSGNFFSHIAASQGNTEVVRQLFCRNADVNFKDKIGRTPLLYASHSEHAHVVRLLLEHDADVNGNATPLHLASGYGHAEVVKLLLRRGLAVDSRDNRKATSLHWASENGHVEVVKHLLEQGSTVNSRDNRNATPLHWACLLNDRTEMAKYCPEYWNKINWVPSFWKSTPGHVEVAKLLLNRGADINARDDNETIPLHLQCIGGHVGSIERHLKLGAEVNARDKMNFTPLHCASLSGSVEAIKLLIKHGADVNAKTESHSTPVHYASRRGHKEVTKLLLEHGADVNARDNRNLTPLHHISRILDGQYITSSHNKCIEVAKLLIEQGADVSVVREEISALFSWACRDGHVEFVESLLKHKVDINVRDKKGSTPLHYASRDGYMEIVKLLLDHGAVLNSRDDTYSTPLCWASAHGHAGVVELLLKHGADVNVRNKENETPFHRALRDRHMNVLKLLLKNGAEFNSKDGRNTALLLQASKDGHLELINLLLKHGADFNVRDDENLTPLHHALRDGHKKVVRLLIGHGADVNTKGDSNFTLLHWALKGHHLKAVELLLVEHAVDVNARDDTKSTPLLWASRHGDVEVVKLLLEHKADVNARDDTNSTPLLCALRAKHLGVIIHLLEFGAEVNATDNTNATPLHCASKDGYLNSIKPLLDHGAKIDARDGTNLTPLHQALINRHLEIAKLLLKYGADVHARDCISLTPLDRATRDGNVKAVQLLLEHGVGVNTGDNMNSTLHWASTRGHAEVVKLLLNHKARVDARDDTDSTPLHHACTGGHAEVVKLLLNHKADVDARDDTNSTSLHHACTSGHVEVVKHLLHHQAHVDAKDDTDSMPLHYACADGHVEVVKLLLKHGADVNARDGMKLMSLHWATRDGNRRVVRLLLEHGADVNTRDDINSTPLHWASKDGHLELVDLLLEHKADVNAPSMTGDTPLCLASRKGYLEIVGLLLAYGADVRVHGEHGQTAFQMATLRGHTEVAEKLVDYGAEEEE